MDFTKWFPVVVQVVFALGFAAVALGLSVFLGKRSKHVGAKQTPYECGMLPVGPGSPRFSVKFFTVAMLFVIFDIEVVFLYPWALVFKDFVVNNAIALYSMLAFVVILLFAYIYALKKGALSWNR